MTGDPVFDGTLKQALAVDLEQSPFLQVIPSAQVQQTLAFMGRQPNERLTTEWLRLVSARRKQGNAVGVDCQPGKSICSGLERNQLSNRRFACAGTGQAASKEQVLGALGGAVSKIRGHLGESWPPFKVRRAHRSGHNLVAGRIESLQHGEPEFDQGRQLGSLPFYRRAVELDPNFAWAYARLGVIYNNAGENEKAIDIRAKPMSWRAVSVKERNCTSPPTTTRR